MRQQLYLDEKSVPKVYIRTFGCQMNEYDTTRMLKMLTANGYEVTSSLQDASVVILNTCSVRKKAEYKVYSELGRLKRLKQQKPELLLAMGGCVAQQEGEKLLERFPYLDFVFGTYTLSQLPQFLEKIRTTGKRIACVTMRESEELYPQNTFIPSTGQQSAFITIMQGCENYCSYCIVPFVRGPERSREISDIVCEVSHLARHSIKEVTLLGQNVNSYGKTLIPPRSFPELLSAVNSIEGLERIRFVTSHPKDLSPELISSFSELEKLCEHIHLPLQSGSNSILKKMNRNYTRDEYLNKIAALRKAVPDISITTDIIVGFPGETEKDFTRTLEMVEEIGFDDIFSFRYSDRPGTTASKYKEKVSDKTAQERLIILQEVQRKISLRKNKMLIGKTLPVLFESKSKKGDGKIAGRTRTNKTVNCAAPLHLLGNTVSVTIIGANIHSLTGKIP